MTVGPAAISPNVPTVGAGSWIATEADGARTRHGVWHRSIGAGVDGGRAKEQDRAANSVGGGQKGIDQRVHPRAIDVVR